MGMVSEVLGLAPAGSAMLPAVHTERKALARHNNNVSHAAETLGLSRSALYRRMQRYGI